jgi:hypothetical protein
VAARKGAQTFDDKRARIAALADEPAAVATAELRKLLGDRTAYLVGAAAEMAQRLELRDLIPELAAAFERLLEGGATADKGCLAKAKLLEALLTFEADVPAVYLIGVRYTQFEPSFPKAVDTAAAVRGMAAHALVQIDHPAALLEAAPLLCDPEPLARAEAARALGRSGLEAAGAALHVKVLAGEAEPDALQACYEAMLRLLPNRYLKVVAAAAAEGEGSRAEAAVLALGESRLRDALPFLKEALAGAGGPRERQTVLMAIALHRSDEACEILLSMLAKAPEAHASAAITALALHRHDPRLAERARAAVEARGASRLTAAFREQFGG